MIISIFNKQAGRPEATARIWQTKCNKITKPLHWGENDAYPRVYNGYVYVGESTPG